ncbi:fatty acid desaturase family protein [Trinickia fusca]|nr:fatty acid desaturase [Trinickia fusca]
MLLEHWVDHAAFTVLAIVFIAGRQHSLYILNHDASHYGLFKSPRTNKAVATLLSNLVMFHHPEAWSFVQWRRVHVFHHMYLFSDDDPNYVGRRMRGDVEREYPPGQLALACMKNGLSAIWQLFVGRQDYVPPKGRVTSKGHLNHLQALFCRFEGDRETEIERWVKLGFFAVALALIAYFHAWRPFLLLWLLPMYTVYPMILSLSDLTEHRWTEKTDDLNDNTRSVKTSAALRIWISMLPRGLHREHHIYPRVIAVDLPRLAAILRQASFYRQPTSFVGMLEELRQRSENRSMATEGQPT